MNNELQTAQISLKKAFGMDVPAEMTVPGFSGTHERIPSKTDTYVFSPDVLRDVLAHLMAPMGALFLSGPHGCGKSSAVTETTARLNWPTVKIVGHDELTFSDMCGQWIMTPKGMKFSHGPLAQAMKYGYALVIDEVDAIRATELMGLHPVADGEALIIPENAGEIIQPHPMFRLFFTGNTAGSGDETGTYQGTKRLNAAFMDRCAVTKVTYVPAEAELNILTGVCGGKIPVEILKEMVNVANQIRKLHMDFELSVSMSTRSLIRWLRLTMNHMNRADKLKYGMERSVTFKAPEGEATAINEIGFAVFGTAWSGSND